MLISRKQSVWGHSSIGYFFSCFEVLSSYFQFDYLILKHSVYENNFFVIGFAIGIDIYLMVISSSFHYLMITYDCFLCLSLRYESSAGLSVCEFCCCCCCCCSVHWNFTVSSTTKDIWKQDPEANIWAQEEWEWGVENTPQWVIS